MTAIEVTPIEFRRDGDELAFLFHDQPVAERRRSIDDLIEQQADGRAVIESFLAARIDGVLVGVQIAVRHGATTCFVWPPVVDGRHPRCEETADALLSKLCGRLERSDLRMGQVMSEESDDATGRRLTRNGFSELATLDFMQCAPGTFEGRPGERLAVETYDEGGSHEGGDHAGGNHDRFTALLDASYVGSLDCAGLAGERTAEEAIAGHRECGDFAAERWLLFRADTHDVGVLLLTDHPEQNAWEVVYVGVHHAHRGRGYSHEMLTHGLLRAREAGRDSVLLAVDAANRPAIRVYEGLGFVPIARRRVHVWFAARR